MGTDLFGYLASVSIRALCLFVIAAGSAAVLRARSAAARHAVWTVVMMGMLLLAVLSPALPPLPLRILQPAPDESAVQLAIPDLPAAAVAAAPVSPAPPAMRIGWREIAAAVYGLGVLAFLARLAVGYGFTRRLVRAARPAGDVYVSSWISVPMTAGWLHPKILLPEGWEQWQRDKLEAVLAHERTHIRRADWLIAMIAGVNRSIFWFHPLAWWIERRLAVLAEQACDDAALLEVPHAPYAEALLDMAAAVKTAQGRLIWEAMAMAKAAEVKKRIERILDETRQIPRGLTRARWMALAACSVPLIWVASVVQLERVSAQEPPATPAAMSELLKSGKQIAPGDVAAMEQYLAAHPSDTGVRTQLILYYYAAGVKTQRLAHIYWMIANHPENGQIAMLSQGVLPRTSSLNDASDYQRVMGLWRQAAATHQEDPQVLGNAAQYLQSQGEYDEAERLLLQAKTLSASAIWSQRLGTLYATAILGSTGDPKFPHSNPTFATRVKTQLESTDDRAMVMSAGSALVQVARRSDASRPLPPGVLNLDDHPLLQPAVEFGARLMARANELGGPVLPSGAVLRVGPVVGGVPGGVSGGTPGGVIGGIIGGVPSNAAPALPTAPEPIRKTTPEYPPLAKQARISGDIRLAIGISADGSVGHIEVISGHPLLIPPTLEAVKTWVFPAQAAATNYQLIVPFRLDPSMTAAMPPLSADRSRKNSSANPMMIRVGGNVQAAKLAQHVDPVYPAQARTEGIEGNVTLQILIDEEGNVANADVTDGNPILARAAIDAVKQWKYQATLLNGEPIKVQTTVTIPFELK